MAKEMDPYPEIPSSLESSIIQDILTASQYDIQPTAEELELLKQLLLGINGIGEELFRSVEDYAINYGWGIRTAKLKVFHESVIEQAPKTLSLQSHEGKDIVFNDQLSGVEIDMMYHPERGVISFVLTDRHEDFEDLGSGQQKARTGSAPSVRLTFRDPSDREIMGVASIFDENGVLRDYKFRPNMSVQLYLLNIALTIEGSPRT